MGRIQTFEKRINPTTGEEYNVLIEDYEVPDEEPVLPTREELVQKANDTIAELRQIMDDLNTGNYIPF